MRRKIKNPNQLSLFETGLEKVTFIEKPKQPKVENVVFVRGILDELTDKVDIKSAWVSDDRSTFDFYFDKAKKDAEYTYIQVLRASDYYSLFGVEGTRKK